MKYIHWELLLFIYQFTSEGNRPLKIQCKKSLIETCIKKGWVKEHEDKTVEVTQKGLNEAEKEVASLYK